MQAQPLGEGSNLGRIDDANRDIGSVDLRRRQLMVSSGGLHHDLTRLAGVHARDPGKQLSKAVGMIAEAVRAFDSLTSFVNDSGVESIARYWTAPGAVDTARLSLDCPWCGRHGPPIL